MMMVMVVVFRCCLQGQHSQYPSFDDGRGAGQSAVPVL
jgi:hypothetical protein